MPKQTFFNLPDEKRNRILASAVDEFADKGFDAASVSGIVEAAGIAKGSFYQYFEDKEDLYGYVVDCAIVQRKLQVSREESAKLNEVNLTQFIRALFLAMTKAFSAQPKLLKIGTDFMRNQSNPAHMRIRQKYRYLQDDYFQEFIIRQKAMGKINPQVDEEVLGYMLLGLGTQIAHYLEKHSYESLTEEYIAGLCDKVGYILSNGIYAGHDGRPAP